MVNDERGARVVASMEPLFFKAENTPGTPDLFVWYAGLQWSRFFSKRKITPHLEDVSLGSSGFNGAAFFKSGKSVAQPTNSPIQLTASMEPLFFKAEN